MKPVLIIQNVTREHAGLIEEVLREQNRTFVLVDLSRGMTVPGSIEDYAGVVMMGGPDSANDTTPKMLAALDIAKQALQLQLPYLGICLGHQVLVKAAGGQVVRSLKKEIGWGYSIQLTEAGAQSPLFQDLPSTIAVFQLHGEMVKPTSDMTVLAIGEDCPVQVIQSGPKAYGLQCHLELTDELYQIWLNQDPDLQQLNRAELEQTWQKVREQYTQQGKQVIGNWIKLLNG